MQSPWRIETSRRTDPGPPDSDSDSESEAEGTSRMRRPVVVPSKHTGSTSLAPNFARVVESSASAQVPVKIKVERVTSAPVMNESRMAYSEASSEASEAAAFLLHSPSSSSVSSNARRRSSSQYHSRQQNSVKETIVQTRTTHSSRGQRSDKDISKKSDSKEQRYNKLVDLVINDKVDAFKQGLQEFELTLEPDYLSRGSTTFLAWATEYGAIKMVRYLISLDSVDINIRTSNYLTAGNSGYSVIMIAADKGRAELVELLLDHGADPNDRNDRRETALMHVAYQGTIVERRHVDAYLKVMKMLLDAGADINAKDKSGSTALMFSLFPEDTFGKYPNVEIIKALLAAGADVNIADKSGMTALHLVCGYQRDDLAMYLLRKGADPALTDKAGRTPWALLTKPSSITTDCFRDYEGDGPAVVSVAGIYKRTRSSRREGMVDEC